MLKLPMFCKQKKAFTLIELMITIAIIAILAVLAVPAFNQYAANNEIASKAEEIQSLLQRTYSMGMSPPPGANSAHIWINLRSQANGKLIVAKADNAPVWDQEHFLPPNDDPDSTDFSPESVTLPNYMFLKGQIRASIGPPTENNDETFCEFRSPATQIYFCNNIVKTATAFEFTLSSNKTLTKYHIEIKSNPFRVLVTKI